MTRDVGGKRFFAALLVLLMLPFAHVAGAEPLFDAARLSSFPLGWYDSVKRPERLPQFSQEGIDAVVPYNVDNIDERAYLDAALVTGVRVMLMIDRTLVMKEDLAKIRAFVARFKSHPAVSGWHLVDEPTIGPDLVSPESARKAYKAIRAEDPTHPVAIVFGIYEDARPFVGAMDVLMFDAYPCVAGRPEFSNLPKWWTRIKDRADIARRVGAYIPVLQGFGEDQYDRHFLGKRLPTAAESRYMAFASIAAGADGLVWWTRYRSRLEWVKSVLDPLVAELRQLRPAIERGRLPGVTVTAQSVTASLYSDPGDGSLILIAVHHGPGDVVAGLRVSDSHAQAVEMRNGHARLADPATDVFGPYEVKVYRLA